MPLTEERKNQIGYLVLKEKFKKKRKLPDRNDNYAEAIINEAKELDITQEEAADFVEIFLKEATKEHASEIAGRIRSYRKNNGG
ncbi:MAG: hypothetical protein WDK96_01350 [Candidatus Paceibacterota bacterium]|jgi:hypothetical protein